MRRRNGEHWMSTLWARRASLHVTRILSTTPITADQLTFAMIGVGLAGAASLMIAGLAGAILAAVGIQIYLLLDCVDGEIARWNLGMRTPIL